MLSLTASLMWRYFRVISMWYNQPGQTYLNAIPVSLVMYSINYTHILCPKNSSQVCDGFQVLDSFPHLRGR